MTRESIRPAVSPQSCLARAQPASARVGLRSTRCKLLQEADVVVEARLDVLHLRSVEMPILAGRFEIFVRRAQVFIYAKCIWLNPEPEEIWPYRQSIQVIRELMGNRMFRTTFDGPERGMKGPAK